MKSDFCTVVKCSYSNCVSPLSLQWGTADAEIKVPSVENLELTKVPSFKFGVGQNVALRTSHTARNSASLISTFPFLSPSFSSKSSVHLLSALGLANLVSCVGPQNKIGHPVVVKRIADSGIES